MADNLSSEFLTFYNSLPEGRSLCRIFERNDIYCIYGEDVKLMTKVLATTKVRTMKSGDECLNYVNVTKPHLIKALKHLLFVLQYKIEILRNTGTARTPQWTTVGKASPGNLTAVEDLLFSDDNSYSMTQRGIMAVKVLTDGPEIVLGVAYCDALLREFQICQFIDNQRFSNLQSVLTQLSPQECLLQFHPKSKKDESSPRSLVEDTIKLHNITVTECKAGDFNDGCIVQDLNRLLRFQEGQDFKNTMIDEQEMKLALGSIAAIIKYIELLADENNFHHYVLTEFKSDLYAKVDRSCEIGLGLFPQVKSDFYEKYYLFGHLNSCFTSAGHRLLIQWIKQPLMDIRKIEERLDIVDIFVSNISIQNDVSKLIDKFIDVEVIARKIQRRKASLQDLFKIYQMLQKLPQLHTVLSNYCGKHTDSLKINFINDIQERIGDFEKFVDMISQTIDFDAIKNKEFVVKAEFHENLTELRKKMDTLVNSMTKEHEKAISELGVSTLKMESYDKIGYTFRVTLKEENRLRSEKSIIRIDTRNSGIRFQTARLKNLSDEYNNLKKEYEKLQKTVVEEIVKISATYIQQLKLLGGTIAWLDVALSLARVAVNATKTYVRPVLKEKGSCNIVLKGLRHPCLDQKLQNYIPNDVDITKEKHRFYFVTGPNMGGKSTYIRSVALSVLLAQIGSFVPCDSAEISITDAFFTRIGASDNPSKSVSTFMYEMLEVKNMITCASPASLLIIDEMGRGTSTYDGLGLSWAISRHIADVVKAPCLFATHFHQLTTLSKTVPIISNLYVDALCSDGDVTFLYRVKSGVSEESLGIHVAKLAEIPDKVIEKAYKKLKELEDSHMSFEEICSAISKAPKGNILLKAIQEVLPFESLELENEEMEVDIPDNKLPSCETNISTSEPAVMHLTSKVSKTKHLLDCLSRLENLQEILV